MRHYFPRTEHLKSRKVIDRLFVRQKPGAPIAEKQADDAPLTFYHFPFRVLYFLDTSANVPGQQSVETGAGGQLPQVLFSVPKRTFKKAVDRNAVRRRVSEAYRLHKHCLLENSVQKASTSASVRPETGSGAEPPVWPTVQPLAQIIFLYTAKTKISFEEIEKGMKLALKKVKGSMTRG